MCGRKTREKKYTPFQGAHPLVQHLQVQGRIVPYHIVEDRTHTWILRCHMIEFKFKIIKKKETGLRLQIREWMKIKNSKLFHTEQKGYMQLYGDLRAQ